VCKYVHMCATFIWRESWDVRSVEQDVIPEVILSQKRYINMGLICSGHGLLCIDSKLNKRRKYI
jgi:hypothetical protein